MNKSVLVILTVIFLLAIPVSAEIKVIHTGWHEYKENFKVEDKVIDIKLAENDDTLLRVRVDNVSALLHFEECREINTYIVCYENKSYDVKQTTISEAENLVPGILINISYYDLSSDLLITAAFGNFVIFENYQVNVTFKNQKAQWLELFNYQIVFPPDVTIVDAGDFKLIGKNTLVYIGSLSSQQSKAASFTITSSAEGTKKPTYNVTLQSQEISKTVEGFYTFAVSSPYSITLTALPANVNILETSKIVMTVKNTGTSELQLVNLSLSAPLELHYTAGRGLEMVDFGHYISTAPETISPGRDKEYYVIATPQYLGRYNFTVNSKMKYSGGELSSGKNMTLIASADGFIPQLTLSKDAALTGSTTEVLYEVSNTNSDITFHNISVKIDGGFFSETLFLDKLNTNEHKTLVRKTITVPYVDEDITYRVNATTTYYTQAGQKRQLNASRNIKITSNGTLLFLNQMLTAREIYEGDELIVELNVRNMKDEVFHINATDIVPAGSQKIGGSNTRSFTLNSLSSDSAYIYKLIVPRGTAITELNITSTVSVPSKGYTKTVSSIVKVKKNLTASQTANNSQIDDVEELNESDVQVFPVSGDTEKKDGAVRRFFRSITAFFENMF